MDDKHGKLIYQDKEMSLHSEDGKFDLLEKEVKYGENGLYAKLYQKKDGKITKYEVIAPAAGGEYKLNITTDGEKKSTTHTKTDLIAFLKKNADLKFIVEYIGKSKELARPAAKKTKTKSKSRSKKAKKSA